MAPELLDAGTEVREHDIGQALDKALLTAYLLTGSMERAEAAVVEGIGLWDPHDRSEALFQTVVHAAVERQGKDTADWPLPVELQSVLGLPPELRRCFVLRILMGLPRQACGRLLRLDARAVNQHTCSALKRLVAQGCTVEPRLEPV